MPSLAAPIVAPQLHFALYISRVTLSSRSVEDWGLSRSTPVPVTTSWKSSTIATVIFIVTSQLRLNQWHVLIGRPTDAALDRFVHNAHRLDLTGESLRRTRQYARKA